MNKLYLILRNNTYEPQPTDGVCFGVVGTKTIYKDSEGTPLRIGDTLKYTKPGNKYESHSILVQVGTKSYLFGFEDSCNSTTGKLPSSHVFTKSHDYTHLSCGNTQNDIIVTDVKPKKGVPPTIKDKLKNIFAK